MDLLKLMFSTFVGAGLAFLMSRLHDAARNHRENLAAGNLALFAVKSQLNEFLLFRKGVYEDVAEPERHINLPLWLLLRPSFQTYSGHLVDFETLVFLYQRPGHAEVFDALYLAQSCYQDFIKADDFRNTAAIELHRELARQESTNPKGTLQDDEKAVGRYLITTMEQAVLSVAKRARDDEKVYQEAFSKLRMALEKELAVWWFRSIKLRWPYLARPTFLNVQLPEPNFRKESLPAMPAILLEALEKLDTKRAENVQKSKPR